MPSHYTFNRWGAVFSPRFFSCQFLTFYCLILSYFILSCLILSYLIICYLCQNVKIQSTHVWGCSCPLLNRTLVYLSGKLQRAEFGVFVKPLWEEVSTIEGGWGLHTIRQLYWQEVGQLCPRIPPTDVWQGKYFHSWGGNGREIICFTIHHSGSGENRRGKSTYMIVYCPWVNLHHLKADPGKCLQIVGYYLLINISQNSLGSCPFITWACLTDEYRKGQQVSLTHNIKIWSVCW